MPAVNMKTKPSIGPLREGPSLHVCHGSTKISKGSRAQVKTVGQSKVPDTRVQIPWSDCSNLENYCTEESDDYQDDYRTGKSDQISAFPLLSSYTTSIERAEKLNHESSCPSTLETFFSPILEHDKAEGKSTSDHCEAVDDEHAELPRLVSDDSDDGRCSPSGYQSWDFTDYNLSNLTVSPSLSFDESMGFSDLITSASPDSDHINSASTFGMEEMYMTFPSPEGSWETGDLNDSSNEEFIMNTDEPLLYFTTHHLKQYGQETGLNSQTSNAEEADWFDPHFFIRMPDISEVVSSVCPLPLQKGMEKKPVTLVLDLDETLVHSTLVECDDADFSFQIFFNMKENTVYVRQRPYLHMFLNRVAQMFEIVIFTASQSIYAEKLLDILDPGKKLISHRVYRESCVFSEGSYAKDLSILGVDLANVAIIDNSPQVFRLQVNNGIPIKSWFDDPSDNALIALLPFLETLVGVEDVRPIIAKRFNIKEQ